MLTQHEHTILLNLIADENSLALVYVFLEKTLQKDTGYQPSDKELSRWLIAHFDFHTEQEHQKRLL